MVQTGGKTLFFPEVPRLTSENMEEQLNPLLQRMMDILEELNRRLFDVGSVVTEKTGNLFIAKVSTSAGSGWWNVNSMKVYSIAQNGGDGTSQTFTTTNSMQVLNLVDAVYDTSLLDTDDQVLCFMVSSLKANPVRFVGMAEFGRGTIGACP